MTTPMYSDTDLACLLHTEYRTVEARSPVFQPTTHRLVLQADGSHPERLHRSALPLPHGIRNCSQWLRCAQRRTLHKNYNCFQSCSHFGSHTRRKNCNFVALGRALEYALRHTLCSLCQSVQTDQPKLHHAHSHFPDPHSSYCSSPRIPCCESGVAREVYFAQ